jgi:quercetin dioxygenase-like cupin family protein
MPVIPAATAPTFTMPGLAVTGLAAPSRGATETSIWRLTLAPGAPGSEHTIDREEVFVVLAGRAVATIDGDQHHLRPGDALVVPPHRPFSLANPTASPSRRWPRCLSAAAPACQAANPSSRPGRSNRSSWRSRPAQEPSAGAELAICKPLTWTNDQ